MAGGKKVEFQSYKKFPFRALRKIRHLSYAAKRKVMDCIRNQQTRPNKQQRSYIRWPLTSQTKYLIAVSDVSRFATFGIIDDEVISSTHSSSTRKWNFASFCITLLANPKSNDETTLISNHWTRFEWVSRKTTSSRGYFKTKYCFGRMDVYLYLYIFIYMFPLLSSTCIG